MYDKTVKQILKISSDFTNVFGVEFELEGDDLPQRVAGFSTHAEGSIRGDGKEYVSEVPSDLDTTIKLINFLKSTLEKKGSVILDTGYAGTHVHVNVSDLTVTQMFNMIILYLGMENVISSRMFGKDREGNLFCLRLSDAEYIGYLLTQAVREENLRVLSTDDIRYGSLNLSALFKYGTLEFRGLRGDGDFERTIEWVKFLASLKEYARNTENPIVILNKASHTGASYVSDFFPDVTTLEREQVMRNLRKLQSVVYEGGWV